MHILVNHAKSPKSALQRNWRFHPSHAEQKNATCRERKKICFDQKLHLLWRSAPLKGGSVSFTFSSLWSVKHVVHVSNPGRWRVQSGLWGDSAYCWIIVAFLVAAVWKRYFTVFCSRMQSLKMAWCWNWTYFESITFSCLNSVYLH